MQEKIIYVEDDRFGISIYSEQCRSALRRAKTVASRKGHVASLPELIGHRIHNTLSWSHILTAFSEEDVGITAGGNAVVAVVHGGGILGSYRRLLHACSDGLTSTGAARATEKEFRSLIDGKVGGRLLPVYTFSEFRNCEDNLPSSYVVVLDLRTALKGINGNASNEMLQSDPLVIARTGGVRNAEEYFRHAGSMNQPMLQYSSHILRKTDTKEYPCRLLVLGDAYVESGIIGDRRLDVSGCFFVPSSLSERKLARAKESSREERQASLEQMVQI